MTEAILFATEDPVGIMEISSILLEDQNIIRKELRRLMKDYSARETCIIRFTDNQPIVFIN